MILGNVAGRTPYGLTPHLLALEIVPEINILLKVIKGNAAGRPPYGLTPHLLRPKEVPLGYSFSLIPHNTRLITDRALARFAHSDEKN